MAKLVPDNNFTACIYIYIYMCQTVAGGTVFLQKAGRFGVLLKAGSGTTRFRTIKIGISEEKYCRSKKGPKITNCTPHGPRGLLCRNTHLNLCTGQLGAKPLRQGVALVKVGFFEVHIVQWLFACTNLEYICVCV